MTTQLRQSLSLGQRLLVTCALLQRREDLTVALRGETYRPKATCPNCTKVLTSIEILRGFSQDPYDYNTTCPQCKHRFAPTFVDRTDFSTATIPFYCALQTLEQLKYREVMDPTVFKKQFPAVYHSAIYHFGSVKAAYSQVSISYEFDEVPDWQDKVVPFLGKMSDKDIAECASVTTYRVSKLRRDLGIEKYSKFYDEALYADDEC